MSGKIDALGIGR